jgi:hypothetical protein
MGFQVVVMFIDSFMDDFTYVRDFQVVVMFTDSFMDDVTYVRDVEICM